MKSFSRIEWLNDLIGLEIVLWEQIDSRLRKEHDLTLGFFQVLFFIARSPDGSLKVGEIAQAMRITVGGCSKLVDRIEVAGLIQRESVVDDRRASRLVLTGAGQNKLKEARKTCDAEMATVLNEALSTDEQQLLHTLVNRILSVI